MEILHRGVISLLRSGITGEKRTLPDGFSLEAAYKLLRRQSVVSLAHQGAVHHGIRADDPTMQKMLMCSYRDLVIHERQIRAAGQVFDTLEAHAIPHLSVKGCALKALYPRPELRPMGDVDILIHPEDHEKISTILEGMGYALALENDHVYVWNSDALHIELHKTLIPVKDRDYYAYYGTGWRLGKCAGGSRYELSAEDNYIFLLVHFARHYRVGGIGCRHVVDLFVYQRAFPELDKAYIYAELKKLRLLEFHENMERLLDVWFRDRETDPVTELITAFIFSGGSWGRMDTAMISEEVKRASISGKLSHSGWKATIRLIFPPLSQLAERYKVVKKWPLLLPLIWVVRWFDILLFRNQMIGKRIRVLRSMNDRGVLDRQQALRTVGLDFDM